MIIANVKEGVIGEDCGGMEEGVQGGSGQVANS